ncbi:elongation of very long chain fatty acids protein AAEL008004-like [Diorhabda sublineata]|uniref:elongation of very long chain fatty acids protein AAEL008004-like n=1 Tax=Diorhabda sublineata TaxID=1163346 RepID=UPI0024E0FCBC|nr:elongation of very long chain fatty acids protein AAEL008004-like [Diorhabda sublineata]
MSVLIQYYNDFISRSADPRVKQWVFMDNPLPTLAIIAVYLLLVLKILPLYMKNRKPFNLTRIIRLYNIFQVVACILLIYMYLTAGWIQGEYSIGCAPVDWSNKPNALRMVGTFYWLYCLKGVELVETIFFALRKKFNQISGLHVYHHSSTFFLTWIGCKFVGGGMASVPSMLNSFIHVLMYTYYYMSSLGPEWQKKLRPWKPRLTMCQMIQFTLLIIHSLSAFHPECDIPKYFMLLYLPNLVLIFKMFYDFYKDSYKSKSASLNHHQREKKIS